MNNNQHGLLDLMKCPQCGVELPVYNFTVMEFYRQDNQYQCPECGYKWE